jgi:rSAM/selenodomain-associated transferase 1
MTDTGPKLLIMAKAPRPGRVKTRLAPLLGEAGCARLQAGLIRHTASIACQVAPQATYLAFDPPDAQGEIARLVPAEVGMFPQHGADLGARLAAATEAVLARRAGPLVVIGTDVPTLTAARLARAVGELDNCDAVFGPALDGGYYLVALREPAPALFAIDPALWGGESVLAASLAAAGLAGLTVGLLPPLRDLDTPADAATLLATPSLPADIAALLAPATV